MRARPHQGWLHVRALRTSVLPRKSPWKVTLMDTMEPGKLGDSVGGDVGDAVGIKVGAADGIVVGTADGAAVGLNVLKS